MYKLCTVTRNNFDKFINMNQSRDSFNKLNRDFLKLYYESNPIQQLLLRKKLKLLKYKSDYIGYIWTENRIGHICNINSMNIIHHRDLLTGYSHLINSIKGYYLLNYECEKNEFNFEILEQLDFTKSKGLIEMVANLEKPFIFNLRDNISFHKVIRGKDERIRCILQNQIFNKEDRIPLDINDIFYDEVQDYYYDDGAILMKLDDEYIGYGQIIIREGCHYIVNFGLLKPYLNKGYGRLFIMHLLNIIYYNGNYSVRIKVDSYNLPAIMLYKRVGFKEFREQATWQLKK